MFSLEVIKALNKPEAPKMPTGATIKLNYSDRCPGQCGSVRGHPRHGKCDAGWPPNDAEGRICVWCGLEGIHQFDCLEP